MHRLRQAIAPAAAAALIGLLPAGCATVMSDGPGNALHADAQRRMAGSIEGGLAPFREIVAGKKVEVRVVGGRVRGRNDAPVLYARSCLIEMIAAEGGTYAGDAGTDVRLDIYSAQAGTRATERNLVVNASQYIRIPIFYGEGFGAESGILVVARNAAGNLIPRGARRGENGEMEYYLFRMIGPFRR